MSAAATASSSATVPKSPPAADRRTIMDSPDSTTSSGVVSYDQVVGGPNVPPGGPVSGGAPRQTPTRRSIKDPLYIVLFIAHVVILLSITSARSSAHRDEDDWFQHSSDASSASTTLIVAAVVGTVAGLGWTYTVFSKLRPKILYFSQAAAGVLLATHAIILYAKGVWLIATIILFIVIGDAMWMLHARPRIKFVEVLLDVIVQAVSQQRSLVFIIVGASIVQCLILIAWTNAVVVVLEHSDKGFGDILLLLFFLFSLRWTCGLIKHIVTVTVSGTFATWLATSAHSRPTAGRTSFTFDLDDDLGLEYGIDDEGSIHNRVTPEPGTIGHEDALGGGGAVAAHSVPGIMSDEAGLVAGRAATGGSDPFVHNPGYKPVNYLAQALTVNIGSICAGALVGWSSPILWAMLRASRRCERARTRRLHLRATAVSSFISTVLRNSHKYAYTQVATRGRGWFQASRETWRSFTQRGVEGVVYDDCTDRLMAFSCYVGAAFMSLLLGTSVNAGEANWLFIGIVVFWYGFVTVGLPLTVLEASISSLFVSFAEVPESLSHCHPIIYHRFVRISELRQFRRIHGDDADDDV